MRALRIWTGILEWRWTPAVGLALGALSYVSLALLVIPDRIGDDERKASRSVGAFQSLRSRTSAFAASIAPSLTDNDSSRSQPMPASQPPPPSSPAPPTIDEANFPRRGFSPPLERVEPPPPPPSPPEIVVQPPPPAPPPAPPEVPPPAPPEAPPAAAGTPAPAPEPPPQQAPGVAPEPNPVQPAAPAAP